jgi:hypothetical protein
MKWNLIIGVSGGGGSSSSNGSCVGGGIDAIGGDNVDGDRLCGLVVRVMATDPEVLFRFPALPDFL